MAFCEKILEPDFSIAVAPSESIRGNIKQMTGNVFWQSRTATESAFLTSLITLQQGEEIQTKENSSLIVEFPNVINIAILPKTQIDFVQTLPVEFVTSIASGSATFKKLSDIPVSVRSYHLLVKQNSGEVSMSIDTDNGITHLNIISGSVTLAYNDLDLTSHVANFTASQKINFNDATREIEVE